MVSLDIFWYGSLRQKDAIKGNPSLGSVLFCLFLNQRPPTFLQTAVNYTEHSSDDEGSVWLPSGAAVLACRKQHFGDKTILIVLYRVYTSFVLS